MDYLEFLKRQRIKEGKCEWSGFGPTAPNPFQRLYDQIVIKNAFHL